MDFIEILEKTYDFVKNIEIILSNCSNPFKKKGTDKGYEIDFNFFSMNSEKKYIGAFFDSNNNKDLTLWAGYDTATNHFCVSFCASHNDIFKQVLEASLFSYSAEYCAFDNGYWYSIFVDTPYKNNKNRESKTSTNEIDYSSLENDIADILKKIDPEVKKKQGTENV